MKTNATWLNRWRAGVAGVMALAPAALAQTPPPDYGFDWSTIGDVGNAPYMGLDPQGQPLNRGSVPYVYRMAKMEITTAQWMEYVNTFSTQSDALTFFADPSYWGATPDFNYSGPGRRWRLRSVPNAGLYPVSGITWREAAEYCNWLHNAKQSTLASIASGAYDTSTFINLPGNTYGDQAARSPGARFFIPTLDEWLKAMHYDPSRNGPGQAGWWLYSNASDVGPIPGPPGVGTTSAAYIPDPVFDPFGAWNIPLGSYPTTLSPWGMLDASGGASEWLENWYDWATPPNRDRLFDGAHAGGGPDFLVVDEAGQIGATPPIFGDFNGLRIASIPSPASLWLVLSTLVLIRRRP